MRMCIMPISAAALACALLVGWLVATGRIPFTLSNALQPMAAKSRYQKGQRWKFDPPVEPFETTLVIGEVMEAHPEWRWGDHDRKYVVYVRFNESAKDSIPDDYDGVVLSLDDAGMDRSVTELVADGVALPWWWMFGRRLDSPEKTPHGRGMFSCNCVSDALPSGFEEAKQRWGYTLTRTEALRKHREKFGKKAASPAPSKSIAESWKRIETWYAENVPHLLHSLSPGASDEEIEQLEKAIGAKLPDDFKESVRIHDGSGWFVPGYYELFSLENILSEWKMYSDWQAKGEYAIDNDDWVPREIRGPIKPVFWNKRRIYIAGSSGDHLTLDLDPPADGKYGQVVDHSHEVGPTEVVAQSWGDFLKKLVHDLESGKYLYDEVEGELAPVESIEKELGEGS